MLRFLRNILQLILNPASGWEDVSYEGTDSDLLAARGMYPLMALAAVTVFVQGIYTPVFELGALLQLALVCFVALLATYYVGVALFDMFVSQFATTEVSTNKSRTIAIYDVSILALIQIIENIVPIDIIILQFLPAFIAIVLWRAKTYLTINKGKEGIFILFAIGSLILPWYVLKMLLTIVL